MGEIVTLSVPALRVRQSPGRELYTFAVDGKQVGRFAAVSRIRREGGFELIGYQRPEVLSHIAEIRQYLERPGAMIPNAVVLAFDRGVSFRPATAGDEDTPVSAGTVDISFDASPGSEKPALIVDGQQRLAAVREADLASGFPLFVVAFVARDVRDQTEQFILVNSTKPLPKGLIYELLPWTVGTLPMALERRREPARIAERLNTDAGSPLRGLIQTPTSPQGVVKDNSILRMIENSLSDGVLYRFREDGADVDRRILPLLTGFWSAVREVFDEAWGLPPKKSRLMHGAGVVSLGFLMDAIAERYPEQKVLPREVFLQELSLLAPICRWTYGYWQFGPGQERKWNEIQNTSRDVQLLSNHLLVHYRGAVCVGQRP